MKVTLSINGRERELDVPPAETLLETLRKAGYRGVKFGCGQGACGACTVILDGRPVNSCLVLTSTVAGSSITTIEGLGTPARPHPIQEAFLEAGAVQCGFCTPGMIMSAKALLDANPLPSEEDIRGALDGNLCRCTGYKQIIEAVRIAARRLKRGAPRGKARR